MKNPLVNFQIPVSILKEGECFVAYSPALDVSSVGDTFEEAQSRFKESVEIFFEEILERGTFETALLELGWTRENSVFSPPVVVSNHLTDFSFQNFKPTYA